MRRRNQKRSSSDPSDPSVLLIIPFSGGRSAAVQKASSSALYTIIVALYGPLNLPSPNGEPEQHGYSKYHEEQVVSKAGGHLEEEGCPQGQYKDQDERANESDHSNRQQKETLIVAAHFRPFLRSIPKQRFAVPTGSLPCAKDAV